MIGGILPVMNADQFSRENEKRENAFDPVELWRILQETITWTEQQLPYEQRRNRPRRPARSSTPAPPSFD